MQTKFDLNKKKIKKVLLSRTFLCCFILEWISSWLSWRFHQIGIGTSPPTPGVRLSQGVDTAAQSCPAPPPGVSCVLHSPPSSDILLRTHTPSLHTGFFFLIHELHFLGYYSFKLLILDSVRFLFLFVIFSHELISHSGVRSVSKCEPYTKHF